MVFSYDWVVLAFGTLRQVFLYLLKNVASGDVLWTIKWGFYGLFKENRSYVFSRAPQRNSHSFILLSYILNYYIYSNNASSHTNSTHDFPTNEHCRKPTMCLVVSDIGCVITSHRAHQKLLRGREHVIIPARLPTCSCLYATSTVVLSFPDSPLGKCPDSRVNWIKLILLTYRTALYVF